MRFGVQEAALAVAVFSTTSCLSASPIVAAGVDCATYTNVSSCSALEFDCYWCGSTSATAQSGKCLAVTQSCDYCATLSTTSKRDCSQLASAGCQWCNAILECTSTGFACPACSTYNTTASCSAHSSHGGAALPGCAWCPLLDQCSDEGNCRCSAVTLDPSRCQNTAGCQWCASGSCQNASTSCPSCAQLSSEYACDYIASGGDSPCTWCDTSLTCYDAGSSYACPLCSQLTRAACFAAAQSKANLLPSCQWCNASSSSDDNDGASGSSGPLPAECYYAMEVCPWAFPSIEPSHTGRNVGIGVGAAAAVAIVVMVIRITCFSARLRLRRQHRAQQSAALLGGGRAAATGGPSNDASGVPVNGTVVASKQSAA